ncbi:NAC domain containing protein 52 isoform X2 [Ziziphus jujuba]|uniref:NAC domain containing protein 52 isoform X2 n=1 Tax=Ziziphus jujuba TaxID=326968 RepID=A0A6P3ZT03_ZIZJJ|nr:NAC domain containing protein 52 isoform X2 [Ziziphus jujuba]
MGLEAAAGSGGEAKTQTAPTALAPGFRFHPTDEELVIYYLKRKVCGKTFRFNAISEVDIYKSEPWDLAGKSSLKSRDQEYYFFSALDKKYGNGARMNRATSQGYWKATGNDRPVKHDSRTVGMKKTLVFHSGRAPDGKRTNWVMHEYRLVEEELEKTVGLTQDAYVLCRVFHKSNIGPPSGQRYAPFIEEEWDDNKSAVVPGMETLDEAVAGRGQDACIEGNSERKCTEDACVEGNSQRKCTEETAPDANAGRSRENAPDANAGRHRENAPDANGGRHRENAPDANAGRNRENGLDANAGRNNDQDTQSIDKAPPNALDLPMDNKNVLSVCKVESVNEPPLSCVVNREERLEDYHSPGVDDEQPLPSVENRLTLPLQKYKRRRHSDLISDYSNVSENSSRTTQDRCSSTTTTAATAMPILRKTPSTKNFLSALVEYSLLESIERKELVPVPPPELNAANHNSSVPPSCMKFIQDLQNEILKISRERETLKFEMTSAQAMINILQSKIDLLHKENEDLHRENNDLKRISRHFK